MTAETQSIQCYSSTSGAAIGQLTTFALTWINERRRETFPDVPSSPVTSTNGGTPENAAMNYRAMLRTFFIVIALITVGCQSQLSRPDFFARSQEDCISGNDAACAMLDAISNPASQAKTSEALPHKWQVQIDVDAVISGIERARSSSSANRWRISPSGALSRPQGPQQSHQSSKAPSAAII
jgi:hypothetical protein